METKPENNKLIFEKEGVYLHTNAKRSNEETSIPGFIRIVERDGEGGEEETKFDPGYEPDWADPYATTFGGFSKVTNFFRGALRPPESPLHSHKDSRTSRLSDDEPGFELITCQLGAELGPRPKVSRGRPLDDWEQFLDSEGRVINPQRVKELVFRGGIVPSLRKEVWKFLLGFYPWNSTAKQREEIVRKKTDEYFRMKVQWKSISEEQEMRNSLLRGYRSLIERDVNRTDRQNPFFSGNENPGLTLLNDVLWTRLPCANFHLLLACAILESQRGELIGSNHDFNTILKEVLGLCRSLNEESPESEPGESDQLLSQSATGGGATSQSS
ncbi:TBC1 domain family member 17 [Bagarius yarrelli]|uniref:TBC1 domain family member 17 n=1 Tax=Bagarius yarrelli TaxID=175774 RepID=A0A556UZM3_BAGYA|nr:TBC1 domain family member 17 [Bagarius yarrelli]